MPDAFTTFRAAYPTVQAAVAACDRPDWMILLAWEALDHQEAVCAGAAAAHLFDRRWEIPAMFNPIPWRIEAVDEWADNRPFISDSDALARAACVASIPAAGLAALVASYTGVGLYTLGWELCFGLAIALDAAFTPLVRAGIAAIVKRRAARLDERSALAIVLDELGKANPKARAYTFLLGSVRRRVHRDINERGFIALADARGMTAARSQFTRLEWEVEPDAEQGSRLPTEGTFAVEAPLALMARRGLEPALVSALLDVFPARPIERALIAYDVLRGSLLGSDDAALIARLGAELAPLKGIAGETVAVAHAQLAALVAAVVPGDELTARDDLVALPSLSHLVVLPTLYRNLDEDAPLREAIVRFVGLLAYAHLPSLALAFLQIWFDRSAFPPALDHMIEVALRHGLVEALPPIAGQEDRAVQLRAYVEARTGLAKRDLAAVQQTFAALDARDALPGAHARMVPLVLAEMDFVLMQGFRLDESREAPLARIAAGVPGWAYPQAIDAEAKMVSDPAHAADALASYITRFGNDRRLWTQAQLRVDDASPALWKILSRELRFGAHEPEAWRALALLSMREAREAIGEEVTARLQAQLRAALA